MGPLPNGRESSGQRGTSRERPRDYVLDGIGVLGIPKHLAAVHDDRESFADLVTEAQPYAPRRIEPDDLDPDSVSEVSEQVLRDPVRSIRIVDHESRGLVPLLLPQCLHVPVREGLGAGGTARFQDRWEQPEELDPRRSRRHNSGKDDPTYVSSAAWCMAGCWLLPSPRGAGKRDV